MTTYFVIQYNSIQLNSISVDTVVEMLERFACAERYATVPP